LLSSIPKGARLSVHGHTDSVGDAARNQSLSRARAAAVAAVVHQARPDLRLDVRGFGESRPVKPNTKGGKDNPEGRAANRRVELRYAS
jgi:outer membrane protein OmpA-like peptidoglycan-associated protein